MSKDRIQLSDHFTTGRLLRFVASPIIMMIFTSVYSVVDGFFVSNFAGKTAFSALNLIYPFLQAFGCLGFMVGTGGSALVAMTLGTGDKKQADNLFSMLAASTIVMGIVSTIIGWFLLEPAAQLLGATPELLPNCLMYGRILLVFQTAFMMQFFFQSFFITSEKPKLGLAFTVLAGLTNIVLDFLLVGVLRGGIVGAASLARHRLPSSARWWAASALCSTFSTAKTPACCTLYGPSSAPKRWARPAPTVPAS